ncbi:DNA-processing protein DprA [Bombilactobacillus thymidiniphilus]|uniref:DNA-processing protein DprA n=1 Tax=Bombilactobacillus thymidiniphilus TaxID=2923363 RepID=A0ABY4PD56_9LACO|nr:DNA-processing protein DprA [Bombilactobacillus thymidiniphilus]UQS83704.1 DNA-processing protein DprA [Bombilactobacillus thymidiniphilus]
MGLNYLIRQLSQTGCVSNQLILKVCGQYYQETTDYHKLLHWVKQQLPVAKQESFIQKLAQPLDMTIPFITFFDAAYPKKLQQIYNPPAILYYQGDLTLLQIKSVAIVGARLSTSYTQTIVHSLVPQLVQHQLVSVSGLALGADACCHQITLEQQGKTIAVLGNGIDYFYPQQNQVLQKQIAAKGLLLSEYPPSTRPKKFYFPQRNRIIAGLCDSLLVTQAKQRSGSLITAQLALQENRNVWAAPGPIDSALSKGCNQLIAAGASPYYEAYDLINELIN